MAVIDGITDYILGVVLMRYHKIGKHAVDPAAPQIAALVPWYEESFGLTVIMADGPFAVIPKAEVPFFAHGTKVFTAVI